MGIDPVTLSLIAVATAVAGTGYSIYQGEKANEAQKNANNLQRKQQDLQAARERSQAIRQTRIAQAQAQNAAASQNVSGSSAAQGGQASIQSQLASNLSFLDQWNSFSDQASTQLGKMRNAEYKSQIGSQVSGLAMTVFANAPEISSSVSKVFKPPTTP
jgi:uncharacterized membrane protein YccC